MCRIYGSFGGQAVHRDILNKVSQHLIHGGPDAQTVLVKDVWALGNTRLAIQGIKGGKQPFELQQMHCVFNGEIYNHRILRGKLEAQGYQFADDCDGNVVLPLYELYGDQFVTWLEGMFAIAIVDARSEICLKLYNDHAGMKSLYYYFSADGQRLCFASELQALAQFEDFPDKIDTLAIDRYLGGKAVWGPGTIYQHVHTLVPGSVLSFSASGKLSEQQIALAKVEYRWQDGEAGHQAAASTLNAMLKVELTRMLDADVPVCVITSGGLDSSYITALAKSIVPDLASFNIAYKGDWPSDERHFAEEVAQHCGTRHHQVLLSPSDFPAIIERFIAHLDQPNNAPHSLSTYALFEAIHKEGFKVALTGDGADELFGGYTRFVNASRDHSSEWHRRYQRTMAVASTDVFVKLYSAEFRAQTTANGGFFIDQSGDEVARRVSLSQQDKLEDLLRYDQFDRFPYYILRRVDHLSMAHAVEARIPFLQPKIMQFAHAMSATMKVVGNLVKAPVANAARPWIPESIINRPKQPFTLPIAAMIKPGEALYEMIGDVLLSANYRCRDYFKRNVIESIFEKQSGTPDSQSAEILWSLLMLETWLTARNISL